MKTIAGTFFLWTTSALFAAFPFTFVTDTKVLPPGLADAHRFGVRVAINGDTAVVGGAAQAYVYVRNNAGWAFQQTLLPDSAEISDHPRLAVAVAVDGNDIAVASNRRASVTMFTRTANTWVRHAVLTSPDRREFGYSVALQQDTLLVGAMEDSIQIRGGTDAALAYVYTRSNGAWQLQAKLLCNDPPRAARIRAGGSVSLDGNTAAVGVGPDAPLTFMGPSAAYVFSRQDTSWVQEAKLEEVADSYNKSVAIEGTTLVIGDAKRCDVAIYGRGPQGWALQQRLTGMARSEYGGAVALKNHRLLIGARLYNMWREAAGSVFFYHRDSATMAWSFAAQFSAGSEAEGYDLFGNSVALSERSAIVGVPADLQDYSRAHIYDAPALPFDFVAPSNIAVEATSAQGAVVTFTASATTQNGIQLPVQFNIPSGSLFPVGTTTVYAWAVDSAGNTATRTFTVTVSDTLPPVIDGLVALPRILWPPNRRFVPIIISATVSDLVDPEPLFRIIRVISNEPSGGERDWIIDGELGLRLRAERNSKGLGRIYTIVVETIDRSGNVKRGRTTVRVPLTRHLRSLISDLFPEGRL
jgi:hypothetical protein